MHDHSLTIRLLTPRHLLALVAGIGLCLGLSLRDPVLLALGTTALASLLVSLWQAARLLKSLRVRRRHPSRSFEGERVHVTLEVENDGSIPGALLEIEDHFPPGDVWRVHHLIERPIRRRETVILAYEGECSRRRGLYTLGPVRFVARDDLGLFRRELAIEEMSLLLVYPTAVDLRMVEVLGDGTLAHVGIETLPRAGTSAEFVGLRPWRPGDNPATIHWRSTARTGHFVVKEFHDETVTEVTCFLDLGRIGLTGLGDQTSLEYAIKSTASLARRAIARAHAVQLYAVGTETEHTPLGKGQRHLLMLLDHLALLKPRGEVAFLDEVRRYVPHLTPGGTVILVVSASTVDPQALLPTIAAMRWRRLLPIVVLIDDRAFIKLYEEQEMRHIEAMGLEDLARTFILQGARVHIVTRARSQRQALLQGLEQEVVAHG
ncbi:MAG: DUF58 domain-containing protein [Candidatus Sumerlaeia bacterium]|nr:DUF58 domain-containing protein [Candidatus Sumerlaeia bacterium]